MKKEKKEIIIPILFIIFGIIFLLNNFNIINIELGKVWPVIFIIIGAAKLFEIK